MGLPFFNLQPSLSGATGATAATMIAAMSRRWVLTLLIFVVLITGAGLTGYWYWSSQRLAFWIEVWSEEQRQRGYEIDYRGPDIGGFPLDLTAVFTEVKVASPQGWIWQAPPLAGKAALLNPFTVHLEASGEHEISPAQGRPEPSLTANFGGAKGLLLFASGGRLEQGEATLENGVLATSDGLRASFNDLFLQVGPPLPAAGEDPAGLLLMAELAGLTLPEDPRNPFGRTVDVLDLEARLLGPLVEGPPEIVLPAWRAGDGALVIDSLQLRWGALDLEARGRLTLDEALRPEGQLTLRLRDVSKALGALTAAGLLQPGQALSLQTVLLGLASSSDERGAFVELPLRFREGLAFLGPLPLGRLQPVI